MTKIKTSSYTYVRYRSGGAFGGCISPHALHPELHGLNRGMLQLAIQQ